jgi:hypothetical protein
MGNQSADSTIQIFLDPRYEIIFLDLKNICCLEADDSTSSGLLSVPIRVFERQRVERADFL